MFYCEFCKISKNSFSWQNTSGRLLLILSLRCWFSKATAHRCFSKQVFLKTSQYWSLFLIIKLHNFLYITLTVAASKFCGSKYIFPAEYCIYYWQSHRLLFRTPLKTRVKPEAVRRNCKKVVLRKFANFTKKITLSKSLFNRVAEI